MHSLILEMTNGKTGMAKGKKMAEWYFAYLTINWYGKRGKMVLCVFNSKHNEFSRISKDFR